MLGLSSLWRAALRRSAPAAAFAIVRAYETRFHNENPDILATVTWTIEAPTPGNSLVFCLKPTLGEAVVLSFVDNLANSYSHDQTGGNGHFFSLSNVAGAPTTLTITVDSLIGCRLYGWELSGCPAGIEVVSGADASYSGQTSRLFEFTTAQADCFGAALIHTSPSRSPVADAGSTVTRLNVQGGEPYSGPVSEHAVAKLFPNAGSNNMGSSWVADGACGGTTSHALYRKV